MDTDHPEKIGPYDILGVIGKGAMGKVYKAAQPPQNKIVAIKVLPTEFIEDEARSERFNREAKAISLLNHRNVVRIVERGEENDQHYFVMEFVRGTSLAAVLRQRRLSLPEAIRVFKGVCKGLEAAHRQSIVHRDLSPRNILVSEDLSVVKIADFGISRIETISRDQGTLSTTEFSLGSLHYMAPEQARNMVSADHRADIYSLGVLLYEMLTGRVPVGRFNLPSQLNSEVPPEVDPIVLRCLEANPNDRYPTVTRLLEEVRLLEDQLRLGLVHEVRGIGSQTSRILLKSTHSRAIRAGLIAVGVITLIGAAFVVARSLENQPDQSTPGGDPVGIVLHERPEIPEPEVDPLADALDGVAAPELEDSEDHSGSPDFVGESSARVATPVTEQPEVVAVSAQGQTGLAEDLVVARNKFDAGLVDEARKDLERLIAGNPRAKQIPQAYLLLGQIHEKQNDNDKARAIYVELQSRFGASEEAAESIYRSAKLLAGEGGRDRLLEARVLLTELAEKQAGSQWGARALLDRAAIETEARWTMQDSVLKSRVPAALATYRDLVSKYPNHPGSEDALWNLGEMYSELKKFDLAVEAFETLGRRFPATKHEAWWRAGQVYDRRLDDDEKAIAAYRNVPSGSRHDDEARHRIAKLSK